MSANDTLLGDNPEPLTLHVERLHLLVAHLEGPQADEIRQCVEAIRSHPELEQRATSARVPSPRSGRARSETGFVQRQTSAERPTETIITPAPTATTAIIARNGGSSLGSKTATTTVSAENASPDDVTEETDTTAPAELPCLDHKSLGKNLVPALEKLIIQSSISNEVLIPHPDNVDFEAFRKAINIKSPECQQATVQYKQGSAGQGSCFTSGKSDGGFKWPDFNRAINKVPSIEEAKVWLDKVINNPPKGTISYYTGHARKIQHQSLLDPGQRVRDEPLLEDLWEPHYHFGDDMSCAIMHTEDMSSTDKDGTVHGLRSANAVLVGIKIWVLISPEAEAKFESFIEKNWSIGKCDRAISHLQILVSPSRLDAEGIAYTIKIGYPGSLIVTEQAQHHMVINMGPCMAESVNFALTGDSVCSPDFAKCNKDDLNFSHLARGVPAPAVPNKRKQNEKQVHAQPNKRRNPTTPIAQPFQTREPRDRATLEQAADAVPSPTAKTRESRGRAALEQVADQLRSAGYVFITPIISDTLPSNRIYRLMCSFMSRTTITAFYDMAELWNSDTSPIRRTTHAKAKTWSERLAMVEKLASNKKLSEYLTRYHQLHLDLKRDAKKLGQTRLTCELKKKMQEEEGMTPEALTYHLALGKKWKELCDIHCSLLPLTSCYVKNMGTKLSTSDLLSESERNELKMMMENITQNETAQKLLRATEAFVNAVEQGEKVEFGRDIAGEATAEIFSLKVSRLLPIDMGMGMARLGGQLNAHDFYDATATPPPRRLLHELTKSLSNVKRSLLLQAIFVSRPVGTVQRWCSRVSYFIGQLKFFVTINPELPYYQGPAPPDQYLARLMGARPKNHID
ncbi:lysine specific demethylase 4c [Fusarium mundagurra]|uniref:Lysine specific demethylase 4c n=1 Tax=Fusarium mundagurra TaxID=1567541 RepID=A0A8H5XM83_9HYPO|nr:lysine specific demethylase 4c [Fusarium mundagurra]